MKNILILTTFLLVSIICIFIISCDDFFSPTIEIFNEIKTPVITEQENTQNKKKMLTLISNHKCSFLHI